MSEGKNRFVTSDQAVRLLQKRGIPVDATTRVIEVKGTVGIDSWGAIDYLCNRNKFVWVRG